jgi:predicted nucleotidyltransferase
MRFGLTEKEYSFIKIEVVDPLAKLHAKTWCFGSRARGDNQKFSDLDLLIESNSEEIKKYIAEIAEKLVDSNFPYKVDLVLSSYLADSYLENINKEKILF